MTDCAAEEYRTGRTPDTIAEDYKRAVELRFKSSCRTKYPIVLIHGTGFRDLKWPVYWGRIPKTLTDRGASIYYGLQDSWGNVETNAAMIALRIDEILHEAGADKVNIIAHSKGGIEARMVASSLGYGDKIASITTVATPHRGSKTIDRLMKLPRHFFNLAAFAVDNWIRIVGDKKPDFLKVCEGFTTDSMEAFNKANPDISGIFYQSYACVMSHPLSDISLSVANFILNGIEGENDGLVSLDSASWGENVHVLRSNVFRGISHLDAIDFRRMPFTGKSGDRVSDICEVYIEIAESLKKNGF